MSDHTEGRVVDIKGLSVDWNEATVVKIHNSIQDLGNSIVRIIPIMYFTRQRRMWKGRKFCYWG